MSMFTPPPPPSGSFDWKSNRGALLLVEPAEFLTGIVTKFSKPGESSDAVRASITVIDGAHAGETFTDTLIFPKVIVSQTKAAIGERVLGRLSQGQAKGAQDPPWVLAEATEADIQLATTFVTEKKSAAAPVSVGIQARQGFTDEPPF